LFLNILKSLHDFELQLEFSFDEESSWVLVALLCSAVTTDFVCWGLCWAGAATRGADVELKIGIVQRFGEEPTDHLKLQATPGVASHSISKRARR